MSYSPRFPYYRLDFIFHSVTIVVMSRLAYRKGIDLLVATAPHVCRLFPNVRFLVGALTFLAALAFCSLPPSELYYHQLTSTAAY